MAHRLVAQPKGSKGVAKKATLYFGPELNSKEFTCAGCMMFLTDTSECSILEPAKVAADGGCGLWVGGKPATSKEHPPMKIIPASAAGYGGDGPFTCKRCRNFGGERRKNATGPCRIVAGMVHADACCNAWEGL